MTQPGLDNLELSDGPAIILELDGDRQTFRAHAGANQFLLVKYAEDLAQPGYLSLKATIVLASSTVLPEELDRFEQYLAAHGYADDFMGQVYGALERCWEGETRLPLGQSSDSSGPTQTEATGSSSTDGSPAPGTPASPPAASS